MASKGSELSTKELDELLDTIDLAMDRLKTLYEQYFLGIQKQAPSFIHNDIERKLRDMQQLQMRNTGLRYRLATLQQKFGSYNSYWRRTLRQIESGTYTRNLAKIGRDAARKGDEIPEEILAAMPKRMREQVVRDRDAALAIAMRRNLVAGDREAAPVADDDTAMISDTPAVRRDVKTTSGAHVLEDDGDLDFDNFFAAFDETTAIPPASVKPAARPDPASTQAITRPVAKLPVPGAAPGPQPPAHMPGMTLRTPEPPTQPTTAIPRVPSVPLQTGPVPLAAMPSTTTTALPKIPGQTQQLPLGDQTTVMPRVPAPGQTSAMPRVPAPPGQTSGIPRVPSPPGTSAIPRVPAPSQQSRPNPIAPGSAAATGPTPVESMNGPFPRADKPPVTQAIPRVAPPARPGTPPPGKPPAPAPLRPPPGMTEADVNALHAKYVQAKQAVGEKVDASSREKLIRTITQTAPKIMEQYKSAGVDFSVVVKDNQVVIKAKPKG